MSSSRYRTGHGQDLDAARAAGSSKLQRAQVAAQSVPGRLTRTSEENIMNKRWAKAAGFNVYREKPGGRRGGNGRIVGKAY